MNIIYYDQKTGGYLLRKFIFPRKRIDFSVLKTIGFHFVRVSAIEKFHSSFYKQTASLTGKFSIAIKEYLSHSLY